MDRFIQEAIAAVVARGALEEVCANSFRNFHAKGFDYLCLKRSEAITLKAYFFDGDVQKLPEVVIPHNHRYAFGTTVLAGAVCERRFAYLDTEYPDYVPYEEFDYATPLNGGDGFHWKRTAWLKLLQDPLYEVGQSYLNSAEHTHTIKIGASQTVLFLRQYADEVELGVPTQSYREAGKREPLSLDGLYDEMTPDHAKVLLDRLVQIAA